ncbi:hypothetical protein CEXT_112061 [Caerostris extrusa]|uniref:Uncharacterized protein n=1 Tax=Caerostris extrusa TaxID=172846 RepID=A0AAV4M566_CAEEX|nr:hypothetical protein CEXT_112061 [Caerostris extrusa]
MIQGLLCHQISKSRSASRLHSLQLATRKIFCVVDIATVTHQGRLFGGRLLQHNVANLNFLTSRNVVKVRQILLSLNRNTVKDAIGEKHFNRLGFSNDSAEFIPANDFLIIDGSEYGQVKYNEKSTDSKSPP